MKGLMLLAMPKGKKEKKDEEPADSEVEISDGGEASDEEEFANLAFDSMRDGDKRGFAKALLGMVKACMAGGEEYADEDAAE